ncbi:MAG: hypothetical protein HQL24_06580 [Candidatus Omnitrophica bacterium]|nr:hypothetical protein [Candidatus Omnitrophota bacterium]
MKKMILVLALVFCMLATPALAFLYETKILTNDEIKQLTDQQLNDVYTEAMIEKQSVAIFQGKAGFTPKEFESFKTLLGFVVRLRQEMVKRGIEAPPVEEWLR